MNPIKVTHESGKLRQEIYIGRHHLVADEPLDMGGEDTGPSPFEFLASALGVCTAMTLRLYAQRKLWPLNNVEVEVSIDQTKETTTFVRKISLIGDLTEEQRSRLLEIANRCPVHRALAAQIAFDTSLI